MSQCLGVPVKLCFAVVTKAKKPVVQLIPVPTDAARITAMKDNVARAWAAIRSGVDHPRPSPANCTICPFLSRCPVFTGK
jgi:hypothetical protein